MDKRFIIFIFASIIIIYLSNYFFLKPRDNKTQLPPTQAISQNAEVQTNNLKLNEEKQIINVEKINMPEKIGKIENDRLEMIASSIGAKITHIYIKKFATKKEGEEKVDLIDNLDRNDYLVMKANIDGKKISFDQINWKFNNKDNKLVFYTEPVPKLTIFKEIELEKSKYNAKIKILMKNMSPNDIKIEGISLNWGPVKSISKDRANTKQIVVLSENKITRINPAKKNIQTTYQLKNGWIGMRDLYFCSIFYGENNELISVDVYQNDDQTLDFVTHFNDINLASGDEKSYVINSFFGPQDYEILKGINKDLDKVLDFGFFKIIAVPLLYVLKFFYKITRNYGLAIILLTIFIKILLWWPTQKSYHSMKKMQTAINKMQPRLKTLKEIYKDNPSKLNEETMKLYKEYQVNPMGGCLPMLLQMPILFALYSTLNSAVELKGAGFFWFWKDLSSKDPYYVLPIIMGLSMFFQQKISTPPAATQEAAAQQKIMLYMLPVMLTFFSFMWPSGLLLYWVVFNLLSIGQQIIINRKA